MNHICFSIHISDKSLVKKKLILSSKRVNKKIKKKSWVLTPAKKNSPN